MVLFLSFFLLFLKFFGLEFEHFQDQAKKENRKKSRNSNLQTTILWSYVCAVFFFFILLFGYFSCVQEQRSGSLDM